MSPERQDEIIDALEDINPDDSEDDLVTYAIAALIRILNCSRQNATELLDRLRRSGAIRIAVAEAGGVQDQRRPLQRSLLRWSRR